MDHSADIIRCLGFVTLNAAYVEEAIDSVMERLLFVVEKRKGQNRWPSTKKADWCINALRGFDSDELRPLVRLLEQAKEALEQRHEYIHGRIYTEHDRSISLKSGREGVPDREITAKELVELSDKLFDLQAAIPCVNYFASMREIEQRLTSR